jgi:hypothetical protein
MRARPALLRLVKGQPGIGNTYDQKRDSLRYSCPPIAEAKTTRRRMPERSGKGPTGCCRGGLFLIIKENVMPTKKKSTGDNGDDLSSAIGAVAAAISSVSDEMTASYRIEEIADNLGSIATATSWLEQVAEAINMATIACYGDDEDKAQVVAHLKYRHGDAFEKVA